ncbi:helix-turn-helix domain-containing protein [Actinoallomurus sp. CA-150999]|uniref:helix-turn-helix domain-containing protein n=1 Tax=Actinoallomurus sp. CA-150999 TaxID=3239887 RepID=UPI003D8A1900
MDGVTRWRDTRHGKAAVESERIAALGEQLMAEVRGHQLAEARKRRGMTQAQVAEIMGVSPGRVSQIENGRVTDVGTEVLTRYVEALGGTLKIVANFGDEWLVVA